jgi:bacterioferritin (cytochrome b1)
VEASDLKQHPPFRVITSRDGHEVISEDVETEIAARTRFASAIDLCKTRDDAHSHRVTLQSAGATIAVWPEAGA